LAVDAEREFIAVQKVRLMQSHVGETFAGTITSVTNFGFFVQLDEFFVDGLVHVTNLGNDYFLFNEHRMTLTGRRSGQQYAVGQKVKVLLAAANILKRQLDFELVQERKKRF
jgi:ribonuclease R